MVLDPERTEVRFNGEWLDMEMEDLFRLARTATVAQLLERDDFAKRYAAGEPISILELLYPLLQGYDSVAVDADVEIGGTDQKFNLLLGRDIQQAYGKTPQSILTMPILPGHRRRPADVEVARQLRRGHRAAGGDVRQADARPRRRDAASTTSCCSTSRSTRSARRSSPKRAMARAICAPVPRRRGRARGRGALRPAARRARRCRTRSRRRALPDERPGPRAGAPARALRRLGRRGRRLIGGGGVRVDGEQLGELDVPAERLDGAVVQVGKRRFMRFRSP